MTHAVIWRNFWWQWHQRSRLTLPYRWLHVLALKMVSCIICQKFLQNSVIQAVEKILWWRFVGWNPLHLCENKAYWLIEAKGNPGRRSRVIPNLRCCIWCFFCFFVYQNKQGNTVYLYGYRVPFLLQNCYYLALDWPHPHMYRYFWKKIRYLPLHVNATFFGHI